MEFDNPNLKNLSQKPFVIYVRHGESEQNKIIHSSSEQRVESLEKMYDPPLTQLGVKQAQMTGEYLACMLNEFYPQSSVYVWVSPLARAQQTANEFLTSKFLTRKVSAAITPNLQEFVKKGEEYPDFMIERWNLKNHYSINEYLSDVVHLNTQIESYLQMKQNPHHILIIFGHSLTFSQLLTFQSNNEKIPLTQIARIHLPNCSISVAQYTSEGNRFDGWQVYQTGSISHLGLNATGIHVPFGLQIPIISNRRSSQLSCFEIFQRIFVIFVLIFVFVTVGIFMWKIFIPILYQISTS
jgi:broad specificity phosphatase PhoE